MSDQMKLEVFPWNDNFSTGIPLVDEQHQKLVQLINKLASALADGSESIKLNEIFGEVAAYADYHFKTEEKIWQAKFRDDAWLIQHQHIHDSFLPKVLELQAEQKDDTLETSITAILKFLINWLVFHILDSDGRMAKVLRALDEGLSMEAAKQRATQEMSGITQTFIDTVLVMYAELASRSLDLIRERTERARTESALLASELQKEGVSKLLRSMEKTIAAMATMVELRSPFTAGHQKRAAKLAAAMAHEMKLPEDEIQGLYLAASIHDIGEFQIPSEIIIKPGRLNKLEFRMIQLHPQAGYDVLKDVDFPWPIAQIIHQHHERIDGSGYPNGLKGDQILREARILAVADVVEAMSSHRPYRSSHGMDMALAEIESQRGICYDAEAVDACIKLIRENRFTFSA